VTAEVQLREGLATLGLAISDSQVDQLVQYTGLLQKWGKVYNLTALKSPGEILTHHLLDSLAVVKPLNSGVGVPPRLLDVGSGAGLPGVVLAIAYPDLAVDCVDTVAKKVAFVQQAAGALRLPNLRGVHSRVETLCEQYPVITARAFASLPDFVQWSDAALAKGGTWMAMKGRFPADEVASLPPSVEMFHVEQLQVPGLDAERCLVWLRRRAA
jgi:16S rRNA (guanine527-N7)-methyltransferase